MFDGSVAPRPVEVFANAIRIECGKIEHATASLFGCHGLGTGYRWLCPGSHRNLECRQWWSTVDVLRIFCRGIGRWRSLDVDRALPQCEVKASYPLKAVVI